jgi:hypothetical protein
MGSSCRRIAAAENLPCGGAKESPSARLDGGRGETTTTLLAVVMILNTNLIVDGKAAGGEFRAATSGGGPAASRCLGLRGGCCARDVR